MKLQKIPWVYILAALCMVWFLPRLKKKIQSAEEFYGIAENQVRSYSKPYDVMIQHIRVRLGQSVSSGDTLMIFHPRILAYKKEDLAAQSRLLDVSRRSEEFEISQELTLVRQQKNLVLENYKIKREKLISQKKMMDSLSGLFTAIKTDDHRLGMELKILDEEMAVELKELDQRINRLELSRTQAPAPYLEKKSGILLEMDRLAAQQQDLVLVADTDGLIGQLDFREGDPVEAYQSLIRIYSTHPSLVTSYIGEGYLGSVQLEDSVFIQSTSEESFQLKGKILNLGSRITALPDRLKKIPELKAWGREVQIEIPQDNNLIQGEKVKVIYQIKVPAKLP